MDNLSFNAERSYLGKLCRYNHEWNGTGKSLRRKCNYKCVECHKQEENQRYYQNWDKFRQRHKKYYQQNKDKFAAYFKDYYALNGDKLRNYQKQYRQENWEKVRERQKRYLQTPSGRLKLSRAQNVRRARLRRNHSVSYDITQTQQRFQDFNGCCAYCGDAAKNLDHFIAISRGGADCLGNLLPACERCNFSKNNADPLEWYKAQAFYQKPRLKKILSILGIKESNYTQLPLF